MSQQVSVSVIGDAVAEASNESFGLTLGNPTGGAVLARTKALGIILDDDSTRTIAISPLTVSVIEPLSGTVNATFTVTLSVDAGRTITVELRDRERDGARRLGLHGHHRRALVRPGPAHADDRRPRALGLAGGGPGDLHPDPVRAHQRHDRHRRGDGHGHDQRLALAGRDGLLHGHAVPGRGHPEPCARLAAGRRRDPDIPDPGELRDPAHGPRHLVQHHRHRGLFQRQRAAVPGRHAGAHDVDG